MAWHPQIGSSHWRSFLWAGHSDWEVISLQKIVAQMDESFVGKSFLGTQVGLPTKNIRLDTTWTATSTDEKGKEMPLNSEEQTLSQLHLPSYSSRNLSHYNIYSNCVPSMPQLASPNTSSRATCSPVQDTTPFPVVQPHELTPWGRQTKNPKTANIIVTSAAARFSK